MGVRRNKTLLEKAQEVAEQVTDQVVQAAHDGLEKAAPLVEKASEKAAPLVEKASEKAAPLVEKASEKAAPLVEKGREIAVEKAAAGAALAATAAAAAKSGAHDVQDRVTTLVDDAKPAKKRKKGGKLKKFVLFSLLAGAAAFAVKKLTGGKEADKWQSAYTPPPAPTPVPKAAPAPPAPVAVAHDSAGADPAEALADATEHPHEVTTPDHPAEEIELEQASDGDVTSDPLPHSDEPAPEVPGKTGDTSQ